MQHEPILYIIHKISNNKLQHIRKFRTEYMNGIRINIKFIFVEFYSD